MLESCAIALSQKLVLGRRIGYVPESSLTTQCALLGKRFGPRAQKAEQIAEVLDGSVAHIGMPTTGYDQQPRGCIA